MLTAPESLALAAPASAAAVPRVVLTLKVAPALLTIVSVSLAARAVAV